MGRRGDVCKWDGVKGMEGRRGVITIDGGKRQEEEWWA